MRNPICVILLASFLPAQITAGRSCATSVDNASTTSSMWVLDHQARTATKLTISAALAAERCNCVLLTSGSTGFVGTNPLPMNTPGNVYRITIAGTTVVETKLNTSATMGGNVAQLGVVGSDVYFTTQDALGGGGILQKVPMAGGAVSLVADLALLPEYSGLANALCVVGSKVYIGTSDSSTNAATPGCILAYDTVTSTASLLRKLPQSKFVVGSLPFNMGIVGMQAVGGNLHCLGVFGDHMVFSTTGSLVSHTFTGFSADGWTNANLCNSFDYDTATGDLIVGTRDGASDRIASGQSAEGVIMGVGTNVVAASNSVTGIAHVQVTTTASDASYAGSGCGGNGGYLLTDSSYGLPTAGNSAFRVGVYSGNGGDPVACLIGRGQAAISLSSIGMTGCNLGVGTIVVTLGGTLAGVGEGSGRASFALPVPASANGLVLYHQWAEVQATKTNALGVVVSNARKLVVGK